MLRKPDEYIRERMANSAPGTTVHEFTDGRIISYTVYPLPDGGGMATHEDITAREEINARLKMQVELGKEQEEACGSETSSSIPRSTTCRRDCAFSTPPTG